MRDDDEIPRHLYTSDEAPECVGTCWHRTRVALQEQTPLEICQLLKQYCESEALGDFCTLAGVNDIRFTWNPHIRLAHTSASASTINSKKRRRVSSFFHGFSRHQSRLFQQFWKAYEEEPSLNLALAFHGTGEANVPTILKYGLDPKFRRTQAFGKGEYFSKDPGLAATYRHEGQKLMVYLLLMPKDTEKVYSQKDRDIIVVDQATHQLPIGYISFHSVNEVMIEHSQQMRLHCRELKLKAIAVEAKIKKAKKNGESTEKLQLEAEDAWRNFLRMKMDAKRNHIQVQVLGKYVSNSSNGCCKSTNASAMDGRSVLAPAQ